ncbi:cartilage intermediate layer protein 2-like [Pseudonaja textilis]|uniref:cartilage intermediate layer protein 2-like n=1 Tax=Pseudonaja textilis TaxID=8673 RepID=UPI000EAA9DF8|nr:cartilage intermediate layer protein 2-like [Pseudonaja textilis]
MTGLKLALVFIYFVFIGALAQDPQMKNDSESAKTKQLNKHKKRIKARTRLDEKRVGKWTSWFNVDHPGGEGDFETLEAIRFYYPKRICARPLSIQARTTKWELPKEVGEVVRFSPQEGFHCLNKEQPSNKTCSNYHVRFLCPVDPMQKPGWSSWSPWSPCSWTACGLSGIETRHRTCLKNSSPVPGQLSKCPGKSMERRTCRSEPCQELKWSQWGAWSPCSKTCGSGRKQVRHRSCQKTKHSHCVGRPLEVKICADIPCPGTCQLSCVIGIPNKDCTGCICPNHTLLGTVRRADGMPLADAQISLADQPLVPLAQSNRWGQFTIRGICAGNSTNISAELEHFAPGSASPVVNGSGTSLVEIILHRLEQLYMVTSPESKVRRVGEKVRFCCSAQGTPEPKKYYWYHNETLLNWKTYNYSRSLVLRDLRTHQAGLYHCKASNDHSSIKSSAAHLTVISPDSPACRARPEEYLIKLPDDCFQEATGSHFYNVGHCPSTPCAGNSSGGLRCQDATLHCCGTQHMEVREIHCTGYILPVKVVAECGCTTCTRPKVLVRGKASAADNGEPLRFGEIYLGAEKIGFTGYKGTFTIEVPPNTERLVVRFVDRLQKFVDAVKVFPLDQRGGAVYQEVKLMRKKEPIDLASMESNTIPLGEVSEENPIGEIVVPPGSFFRSDGQVYNGTVKASITFVDPRDIGTVSTASSDLNFINAEGDLFPLRTYGMFSMDFWEEETRQGLEIGRVEIKMDTDLIKTLEHTEKMKLWSLNPITGLWEEEASLKLAKRKRKKREERNFLIGNLEVRERRLFNLDVAESRRCFVKVRTYINEKFYPSEQLEGVVVTLINLEPRPGYPSNPRAWGRFDSVVTGPNGACLPAFCDSERADAYTAYVTATMGGEELEAVPSSPKLNPRAIGVSQPYLNKLGYQRTDHEDPALKKTAFRINLAKPNQNNIDETNGPIYAYRHLKDCDQAPVTANHFRFYRVEEDKYEYNVVPFKETDLTTWTGDYLSWWPNPQEFRACYIKVKINGPHEYMVRSRNVGGSHPRTRGQLYGLRDSRSIRDVDILNSSAACVEFKCSGMLFDQGMVDRTIVSVIPQGNCYRMGVNSYLREYLSRHPPLVENNDTMAFTMLAPVDPLGHNYGIYTVTDQNPHLAKEIAIGRCFAGTSDGFSREMKSDRGTAVTFTCYEKPVGTKTLFQRLLESPAQTLTEMRREMTANEQLQGPSQAVAYPSGLRTMFSTQRRPSRRRRVGTSPIQQ